MYRSYLTQSRPELNRELRPRRYLAGFDAVFNSATGGAGADRKGDVIGVPPLPPGRKSTPRRKPVGHLLETFAVGEIRKQVSW